MCSLFKKVFIYSFVKLFTYLRNVAEYSDKTYVQYCMTKLCTYTVPINFKMDRYRTL